jgi:hypothetical protein
MEPLSEEEMHLLEVVTEVMECPPEVAMALPDHRREEEVVVANVVAFGSGARVVPAALVRTVKS